MKDLLKLLTIAFLAPEGENTEGAGAGSSDGNANTGANPPGDDEDPVVPQSKVDELIRAQTAKERARFERQLQEAGVTDLDEVKRLKEEAEEAKRRKMEEEGNYKELLAKLSEEKEAEIAKERARAEQAEQRFREATVERRLLAAAQRAINPEQVVRLVSPSVRYDAESGDLYVVDAKGQRATDGKGALLSPEAFVNSFLESNPHFLPAASGKGGNSGSNAGVGGKPPTFDVSNPAHRVDVKRMQENREEIIAKMKSGEIKG